MTSRVSKKLPSRTLYGISFDGVVLSGITMEFAKLARYFRLEGYEIFLDLGYDIKTDKESFLQPYAEEISALPAWIQIDRLVDSNKIGGYGREFLQCVAQGELGLSRIGGSDLARDASRMVVDIANQIVATWRRLGVTMVVVENGTLPENLIFTRALYQAIDRYGREEGMGKYVLWRDHDIMWFCEPEKYGRPPYSQVQRPAPSPYVHYATLTSLAARTISEWSGGLRIEVIPNCFEFRRVAGTSSGFRDAYSIPKDAFVIARCTRIIPQKRIDRDIVTCRLLSTIAGSRGYNRSFHLVITGRIDEHPSEHDFLRRLAFSLGLDKQVHFVNGLSACRAVASAGEGRLSVTDLLAEADLSSFLTSYRYEGFGTPPAEACAHGLPFMCSTYQLYDEVYGSKGLRASLLPISPEQDSAPSDQWAADLFERIVDEPRMHKDAEFNFERARAYFSLETLERKIVDLFSHKFTNDQTLSHVDGKQSCRRSINADADSNFERSVPGSLRLPIEN
jgi:glycosyltransferase involved in cell wall biosynthesis